MAVHAEEVETGAEWERYHGKDAPKDDEEHIGDERRTAGDERGEGMGRRSDLEVQVEGERGDQTGTAEWGGVRELTGGR